MVLQRHFWSLLKRRDYLLLNNNLEVSVLNLSEVKKNSEMRIDSDFFLKEYLQLDSILEKAIIIEDIVQLADVTSNGSFKAVSDILNDTYPKDVPYIRSGNVGNTFLNTNELTKISRVAHDRLVASQTKLHDVMMARKGKIGGASIITENEVGFNCNENVVKLTLLSDDFNPFYFTTFFNSKYGLKQVERFSTGNVQPWLSMFQIRKLKIPKLSKKFQFEIEKIIKEALSYKISSDENYNCAEKMLLDRLEFSLEDEKFVGKQLAIKKFKEIQTFNRFDAEYFQPKFDFLIQKIKENNFDYLTNLVDIQKSIEPGSEFYENEGIPFIRVADIDKFGIEKPKVYLSPEYFSQVKSPKKNTILFSKDGTCGIAHKFEDNKKVITSSALLHLTKKNGINMDLDYLTLVLNSPIVQMQAERDSGGSVIKHWSVSQIEQVVIPMLDKDSQITLGNMVRESFTLRKKSRELIKIAQLAVEIAIEEDEEKSFSYIVERL